MQIAAPPIPFYRAAGNRPPELSHTAAVRLRLLEQWRATRDVLQVGTQATSASAARFLDAIVLRSESPQSISGSLIEQQLRLGESNLRLSPLESALEFDSSGAINNELAIMSFLSIDGLKNELDEDDLFTYQINDFLSAMAKDVVSKLVHPLNSRAYYLPADRTGVMHAHHVVVNSLIRSAARAGLYDEAPLGKLSGVLADFLQQLVNLNETQRHRAPFCEMALLMPRILRVWKECTTTPPSSPLP